MSVIKVIATVFFFVSVACALPVWFYIAYQFVMASFAWRDPDRRKAHMRKSRMAGAIFVALCVFGGANSFLAHWLDSWR